MRRSAPGGGQRGGASDLRGSAPARASSPAPPQPRSARRDSTRCGPSRPGSRRTPTGIARRRSGERRRWVGADDLVEQRKKRRQQQRPRGGRRRRRRRRRAGGGRDRRAIGLDEARGVGAAALAAIAEHPRCVFAPGDDRVQRGRPRQRVGQRRDDRREGRRGPEAIQRQLDLRVEERSMSTRSDRNEISRRRSASSGCAISRS